MFQRFNPEARRVVVLSQEESRLLNHDYIGTEHVLLGLVSAEESVAAQTLTSLGLDLGEVRERVLTVIGRGSEEVAGHIPFTPRAKKILELGLQESIELGHHYIGSEHLLLGLLREGEGVAAQVLNALGVELGPARSRVVDMLGPGEPPPVEGLEGLEWPAPATGQIQEPALPSLLFVAVALVAVVIEPPGPVIRLWGLSLLLGGVLLWAGGAVIGTAAGAGPRSRGMGRLLRVLGGLTLAAAASLFVLGAMLL